jgi:hypothetical protein
MLVVLTQQGGGRKQRLWPPKEMTRVLLPSSALEGKPLNNFPADKSRQLKTNIQKNGLSIKKQMGSLVI